MTLSEKQQLFAELVAQLILKAIELDYRVTLGEAYRTPEQAAWYAKQGKGIANSLHTLKLAIDLNLFKEGVYLTASEDYKLLGEWWKEQHASCCWGGDFKTRADGNHFSLEHNGVK